MRSIGDSFRCNYFIFFFFCNTCKIHGNNRQQDDATPSWMGENGSEKSLKKIITVLQLTTPDSLPHWDTKIVEAHKRTLLVLPSTNKRKK